MRDSLKHIFDKLVTLEDGSQYYYSIKPFEMLNALGMVVAVLEEYTFTKKDGSETCKLYRTKDGNWYDISEENTVGYTAIVRALKSAYDNRLNIPG